jgi:DNA polymerase
MFKQGKDTYRAFASEYYHKPYDQVTKEERFFCKPPVLGAGYRLSGSGLDGTGGLVAYAAQYGITMTPEEGNAMIAMFRRQYWEIPAMWDALDATVQKVVNNKIDITGAVPTGRCWFWLEGPFLKVRLPSGRDLHYFEPRIEANDWGKPGLTYMGVNQYTQQWERISTHSGKIIENLIQGIARDVFWNGVMLALKQGLNLFGRVHDEAIGDEPEQEAEEKLRILIECMTTLPKWADEDLILGADGFITKRYKKG